MKMLHIKVNTTLDEQGYEKVRKRIEDELESGFLITDKNIQAEVLEFNVARLEEASSDDLYQRHYACHWVGEDGKIKPKSLGTVDRLTGKKMT
ncbi:hypothetical protein ACDX78_02210 [Virgibacillus oceani]